MKEMTVTQTVILIGVALTIFSICMWTISWSIRRYYKRKNKPLIEIKEMGLKNRKDD